MKATYFVSVSPTIEVGDEWVDKLSSAVRIFEDEAVISSLTKGVATSSHTEANITVKGGAVCLEALIDLEGETKSPMDKPKLSTQLKKALGTDKIQVEKKFIDDIQPK
jgi:hypothetical protein